MPRMAAENTGITDSNHECQHGNKLDEVLRLLRKHDDLLEQFRPLLTQYASMGLIGAAVATRRARRLGDANGRD